MNKSVLIAAYGITTLVVILYLAAIQDVRRCYFSPYPNYLFVDISDAQYRVRNEQEYLLENESTDSFTGIAMYVSPRRTRGPMKEGFTFYYSTRFMSSISEVSIYDLGKHSQEEKQQAFEAAVEYAKSNPLYASYRPGEPASITFDKEDMFKCCIGVLTYLGLPLLITWILSQLIKSEQQKSWAYRRKHMQCVHCTYSIEGLGSHICPECGQLHGSSIEATA